MNEFVNYVFRHMDITDKNFRVVVKCIKRNSIGVAMNSIAILSAAGLLHILINENKNMKQDIESLKLKIDELNEPEGV